MAGQALDQGRNDPALYTAFGKSVDVLLKIILPDAQADILAIEENTSSSGDRTGLTIVTYLAEDCEKISRVIHRGFEVVETGAEAADLDAPAFADGSIKLVVGLDAAHTALPEFRRFAGLKADIQIRTLLQHSWAAINAKLGYADGAGAPPVLRRRLHRIGAFLEAADEDFALMWSQREGGEPAPRSQPAAAPPTWVAEARSGNSSLHAFLDSSPSVKALMGLAETAGVAVSARSTGNSDYASTFLGTMAVLGIETFNDAGDHLDRFNRRGEEILGRLGEKVDIDDEASPFTRPGFVRLALILSTPKVKRVKALKKFPIRNLTEDVVAALPEV